ncbi:hypothetical protein FOFC_21317 [Fusarium oxysporum]|nr:hypothetical protein FOFC_21317 [Fusarium oxysporum]
MIMVFLILFILLIYKYVVPWSTNKSVWYQS